VTLRSSSGDRWATTIDEISGHRGASLKGYKSITCENTKTVQKKVAGVGFEWDSVDGVFDKPLEETNEIREVLPKQDPARIEDEVGDLMFSVVNLARFLSVDPERALHSTVTKFSRRFHEVETELRKQGRTLEEASLEEMDAIWDEVKGREGGE